MKFSCKCSLKPIQWTRRNCTHFLQTGSTGVSKPLLGRARNPTPDLSWAMKFMVSHKKKYKHLEYQAMIFYPYQWSTTLKKTIGDVPYIDLYPLVILVTVEHHHIDGESSMGPTRTFSSPSSSSPWANSSCSGTPRFQIFRNLPVENQSSAIPHCPIIQWVFFWS